MKTFWLAMSIMGHAVFLSWVERWGMEREFWNWRHSDTFKVFHIGAYFSSSQIPWVVSGRYSAGIQLTAGTSALKIQMQYEVNPRSSSSVLSEGSPESHIAKPWIEDKTARSDWVEARSSSKSQTLAQAALSLTHARVIHTLGFSNGSHGLSA